MAKKQAQFRFEQDFYKELNRLATEEGLTVSEAVRNAIKLYIALYDRTKGTKAKLFIDIEGEKCEVILPWAL